MSHFSVMVITEREPDNGALTAILQPWHEFECTGTSDEYVQDVDKLEEVQREYKSREDPRPFEKFIEDYYGYEAVYGNAAPNYSGDHKYGYYRTVRGKGVTEVRDRTNVNAKWDWWQVGGRWSGHFSVKADVNANPDSLLKAHVDFESMKDAAADRAANMWNKVHRVIGEHVKGFVNWSDARKCHGDNIDAAREFYNSQPAVKAIKEASKSDEELVWITLDEYICKKSDYVKKAYDSACATFAVVKDGQWYEKGEMGWFGCVGSEKSDWHKEFNAILADTPDDHWLTIIDCHI